MRFRLTYKGALKSNADGATKASIRAIFDQQLRRVWEQEPLDSFNDFRDAARRTNKQPGEIYLGVTKGAVEFMPIVSPDVKLRAEIDVLILGNTPPGHIVDAGGALDNRVKTLLDALTIPSQAAVLDKPGEDGRVYCLLSDDKLVSRVAIESDRWLEIEPRDRDVLVVVSCEIRATSGLLANISVAL